MRRCPACHREFDDDATHCEADGQALEASSPAPNDQEASQAQTLADFIKQRAPLEIERAVRVAIAICQAVEELERAGRPVSVLHPRNLAIESREQVDKITRRKPSADEAAPDDEQLPDLAAAYLSPEAAQQQPTDAASVVYSIGAMLYELLTGQPPFTAATAAAIRVKHILEPPRPLISLRPEIPIRLQEITLRALEKESAARQSSPAELQRELEATLTESYAAWVDTATTSGLVKSPSKQSSVPDSMKARYQLETPLGQGAMGYVCKAKDLLLGMPVALKKIALDPSLDPEMLARYRRAAKLWGRVRHPNVVTVLDVVETRNSLYIVMEFVDGKPLSSIIREQEILPLDRVIKLTRQMAEALHAAHRLRIVHGDFKPGRVIVAEQAGHRDSVKVGGFTYARSTDANEQLETPLLIGTPAYMSPEQITSEPLDARSDLYSLAIVVYEMLSGIAPFRSGDMTELLRRRLTEEPPPLRAVSRQPLPRAVESVIMKALARRPENRYSSTLEFADALELASQPNTGAFAPASRAYETMAPAPVERSSAPEEKVRPEASATQEIQCPNCDAMNEGGWAFCQQCGSRLPQMQPPLAPSSPPPPPMRSAPSAKPPLRDGSLKESRSVELSAPPSPQSAGPPPTRQPAAPVEPPLAQPLAQTPAQKKICSRCGRRNAPSDAFCTACGNSLARTGVIFSVASPIKGRLHLVMESGQAGETYELGDETVIGRTNSDIAFPQDELLARRHSRISRRGDRYVLVDEGSPNGTFIRIRDEITLQSGDVIRLGKQLFQVEIELPDPAPPPDINNVTHDDKPPSFYDLQTPDYEKQCAKCGARFPARDGFCIHDGERLQEVALLPPPDEPLEEIEPFTIAQYFCFARLGEGGMGVVYKARHIHLDRLSAVKIMLPGTDKLPDAVSRFKREAQIASRINHPNSVLIYDYGEAARLFYLAMEFIPGKSLAGIIQPDKEQPPRPLSLARTLNITRQICDALDAAHQAGIVHRDLKPQNVMVSGRPGKPDLVKVVDFGLARSPGGLFESLPGTLAGTPAYMSPEQARMETDLDARSDIFSLAVMVYQMLGGQLPFPTKGLNTWTLVMRRAALEEGPPPLSRLRPDLLNSAEIDSVLLRALAPRRDDRTPSAALFIEQMERAARL